MYKNVLYNNINHTICYLYNSIRISKKNYGVQFCTCMGYAYTKWVLFHSGCKLMSLKYLPRRNLTIFYNILTVTQTTVSAGSCQYLHNSGTWQTSCILPVFFFRYQASNCKSRALSCSHVRCVRLGKERGLGRG